MNFSDLCTEVYNLTGRPDRVAETESAVKSATLKAHQSDYYYKDIFESVIQFSTTGYVQNLDYRALLPRWRALKYLRKIDISTGTPGKELDVIVPENVFDEYKIQKQDICYVAGAYVQINSSTQEQYYILGCYLNPDITSAGYTSWVALDHPYAIIFDAAATVFKAIGKDEEASAYRTLTTEQLAIIKSSNIVATGF
jgi:hypothetical protein